MRVSVWLPLSVLPLSVLLLSSTAHALIPVPVGGHAGDVDATARVTLERGKVEPNENPASWQKANWELYSVGGGYTYGDAGPIRDLSFRFEGTWFTAPAERSDPSRGTVAAERCLTGRIPAPGQCVFHSADSGVFLTPSVAFNIIHKGDFSFGFFVLGNIPVGIDYRRFVVPRTDFVAGGFQTGTRLTPSFTFESRTYLGSGLKLGGGKQNGTIAITNLLGFEASKWLLPWKAGIKGGSYFDGDLFGERSDAAYDAAYTAGYPDRTDRIRMMRFGVVVAPYAQITEHAAIELSFVQKIFGYDTPATKFLSLGVRGVL
jgi:hypothetical protein